MPKRIVELPDQTSLWLFQDDGTCDLYSIEPENTLIEVGLDTGDIVVMQVANDEYARFEELDAQRSFPPYSFNATTGTQLCKRSTLAVAAQSLWDTGKYADVKIQLTHELGKAEFQAHRAILCSVPYFDRLFSGGFADGKRKKGESYRVTLMDLKPCSIKTFLEWLYLGESTIRDLETTPAAAVELIKSADYFGSSDLKESALLRCRFNTKKESQGSAAIAAIQLTGKIAWCKSLKRNALKYIAVHFQHFSKTQESGYYWDADI